MTPTRGTSSAATATRDGRARGASAKPPVIAGPDDWYKDAVIYEVHVRAFADSNADGVGDFAGLTERLDYLHDLGVTAVWLLPFYPSPLRDDGYDIADYTGVHPDYGTMRDFRRFVAEAHKRQIRVITELVINHTSDQHPWFHRARTSPPGSRARGYYVWSDTPDRYRDVRIIFQDTEASNWSWDPVAQQYYWHRFFSHQPDLNYENPEVQRAVLKVMDFWFGLGVDGMRLDAIPYIFEREGTNCENLPETHAFLKKLRSHLDAKWPGRMFLAEANQWPEDAIAYFGEGDECHMNFHFPLMPRLFMALRMEDRFPIEDILRQTPPIPESCQWAMFLRNHDELTLEMVTDEERDYMYRTYAADRQMRINLGIRRRLSPLLDNNRRKIELMNGLLMSLPGTPVLYYGDEIGMGDNVYLGDRDAVRTPMQWTGDRNAGFSRANPQSLYLPVIIDPEHHYETVNVESEQSNLSSLYWWMRRLIALRKRHPMLARGDLEFLHPENGKVLVFLRRYGREHMLVVANLSRFVQPVELDLSDYAGLTPVEVFGQNPFPRVGELPYFLTIGPHAFYWFRFDLTADPESGLGEETPAVDTASTAKKWFGSTSMRRWLAGRLPAVLPERRWFASKAKVIREVSIEEFVALGPIDQNVDDAALTLVRVQYVGDDDELYAVPLALADGERVTRQVGDQPGLVFGYVRPKGDDRRLAVYDATADEAFWAAATRIVRGKQRRPGLSGELVGVPAEAVSGRPARRSPARGGNGQSPRRQEAQDEPVRVSKAEQSNSSAILGDRSIIKLYRRVEQGQNPDSEIGRHLSINRRFPNTPATEGELEYRPARGPAMTIAMIQQFVPNEGDAWRFTLDAIGRYFERVLALPDLEELPPMPGRRLENPPSIEPAPEPEPETQSRQEDPHADLLNGFGALVELLGQRTAEMHIELASSDEPDFAPEPYGKLSRRSLYQSLRNDVQRPLQTLRAGVKKLDGSSAAMARRVLDGRDRLMELIRRVAEHEVDAVRMRCHGDYHLGQVLWTGRDFVIIDFEGEPMRPLGERRLKRSCLADVAGMVRSFDYAAHTGLRQLVRQGVVEHGSDLYDDLLGWTEYWRRSVEAAYLQGFLRHVAPPLVPSAVEHREILLTARLIQKASYEVGYELNNRPDWVEIPLRGLLSILDDDGADEPVAPAPGPRHNARSNE